MVRLARIISFAFSLPPTWAVRQLNRATAEEAQEVDLEEGLAPLMVWVKRLIDTIIQDRMGHADLEFAWSDKRPVDPVEQQKVLSEYVRSGVLTRNEARDAIGLHPIPGGEHATVTGSGGIRLVKDLKSRKVAVKASGVVTKRGNPANSLLVRLAAARLRRVLEKLFIAEVPLVAAEIIRAISKYESDNNDDANTADQDKDKHWLEAIIAAVLLTIDFSRWKILIVQVAAILSDLGEDIFANAANEVDAADIAADGAAWAGTFARDRAAELVDPNAEMSIVRSTRDMLRPVVGQAIKEKMDLAQLTAVLRQSTAFSRDRAERISDSETRNVFHKATLESYRQSGKVEAVRWITMGDDRVEQVCAENEAIGPIALGEDFPSGHQRPPAHNFCRCFLAPADEV